MNLKGILVGNAATNWHFDGEPAYFETAFMHNILSQEQFYQWRDNGCSFFHGDILPGNWSMDCDFALTQFFKNMEKVNIYDMYRPYDTDFDNVTKGKTMVNGEEVEYERGFTMQQYTPWIKISQDASLKRLGFTASDYLN